MWRCGIMMHHHIITHFMIPHHHFMIPQHHIIIMMWYISRYMKIYPHVMMWYEDVSTCNDVISCMDQCADCRPLNVLLTVPRVFTNLVEKLLDRPVFVSSPPVEGSWEIVSRAKRHYGDGRGAAVAPFYAVTLGQDPADCAVPATRWKIETTCDTCGTCHLHNIFTDI